MKKSILYYTQVCYLDIALEYIRLISPLYNVHVVIELASTQLKTNILDLEVDLGHYHPLTAFDKVREDWKLQYLSDYLRHCKSVNFAVYPSASPRAVFITTKAIIAHLEELKPDYYHLDDLSPRQLLLIPHLYRKVNRLILNIHDPRPHLGEFDLKNFISRSLFRTLAKTYAVYSEYSKDCMDSQVKKGKKKVVLLKMMPYSVFSKFQNSNQNTPSEASTSISFIGRISPYKGVENFIEAARIVNKSYPNQHFIIAGKKIPAYDLKYSSTDLEKSHIEVRERHLSNTELVEIVNNSSLVVCPYLEATQSGVVMTAYALNRPVLVTNCGGLAENVQHGVTGLVAPENTVNAIAGMLLHYIKNALFSGMSAAIREGNLSNASREYNLLAAKQLYTQ